MYFALFLDLNNLTYYGYIPNFPENAEGRVEIYQLENDFDDVDLFFNDLDGEEGINNACESLLGYGDVDYLNAEKCEKLMHWIENRRNKSLEPRYEELLAVLYQYCKRAVELKTGVVIDL